MSKSRAEQIAKRRKQIPNIHRANYYREKMQRVTRKIPCPVCGKPDWCLVAPDKTAAICQRIQEGSVKRCGDAGWLHILIEKKDKFQKFNKFSYGIPVDFKEERNFFRLSNLYKSRLCRERLQRFCEYIKISMESLRKLSIGWDGNAYTFPMCNDLGQIIGIRRRFSNGTKVSVKASKSALFIPTQTTGSEPVLICEGPTDTATALDLGFYAIGRPNCNSCVDMTARFVKGQRVVIIGDNDDAGKTGAEKLAKKLILHCSSVKVIYPTESKKDLRQWFQSGLTGGQLRQILENTKPSTMELK